MVSNVVFCCGLKLVHFTHNIQGLFIGTCTNVATNNDNIQKITCEILENVCDIINNTFFFNQFSLCIDELINILGPH